MLCLRNDFNGWKDVVQCDSHSDGFPPTVIMPWFATS